MTKDEALKLAMDFVASISPAFICEATHHKKNERHADNEPCPHVKKQKQTYEAIKEALAQDALDRKAENARELGLDYEPAQPMHPEIKKMYEDYFDKCFRESSEPMPENFIDALKFDVAMRDVGAEQPAQRTWVGLTPSCPKGLLEYHCDIEGVDVVCFLEYTPDEEGSRDSYGLLNEPGTSENLELVNAYVKGTDVDIGHLLMQSLVDHITTTALEDFKNDDL